MSPIERLNKKTIQLWAAELSLAICLVYALFYLASYLGLQYSVLSNRAVVDRTVNGSIFSGPFDIAIWATSILLALFWLGYSLKLKRTSGFRSISAKGLLLLIFGLLVGVGLVFFGFVGISLLVLVSFVLLFLNLMFAPDLFGVSRLVLFLRLLFAGLFTMFFVELASFILFSIPLVMGFDVGATGFHWSSVELAFANLSYPFLPYVYLLLVLLAPGAFVFRVFPKGWQWIVCKTKATRALNSLNETLDCCKTWAFRFDFLKGNWVVVLAVIVSAFISCLFVVFTVLPWSNPTGMLVSVDSPVYYGWISHMKTLDVNSALSFAFSNDRAIFLVLGYALSFVAPTVVVVQSAAALLLVLLTFVTVFVLRLLSSSRMVQVLGVLLVPFSFSALGLIFAGYFANMLALILIFTYIVLFFRLLNKWSNLGFFSLIVVSVLVLFSHSWTWFVFVLSLGMYLFLEWRLTKIDKNSWGRLKNKVFLIGITVGVGLTIDVLRTALLPISSSSSALNTAQSSLGLLNPAFLVSGMKQTVGVMLGGVFANQIFFALSFMGLLVLLRFKSEITNFFVAWLFVACVSIIFAADNLVFNRALFLVPWVVLSALGLNFVIRFVGSKFGELKDFRNYGFWVVLIVLTFVFLVLVNFSLRFLFNINIW
jgi:hypothetical protein